jgi:hypothetical protein
MKLSEISKLMLLLCPFLQGLGSDLVSDHLAWHTSNILPISLSPTVAVDDPLQPVLLGHPVEVAESVFKWQWSVPLLEPYLFPSVDGGLFNASIGQVVKRVPSG